MLACYNIKGLHFQNPTRRSWWKSWTKQLRERQKGLLKYLGKKTAVCHYRWTSGGYSFITLLFMVKMLFIATPLKATKAKRVEVFHLHKDPQERPRSSPPRNGNSRRDLVCVKEIYTVWTS